MFTHAILLSLVAFATAKETKPLISNTTLLAVRYNNDLESFEMDAVDAYCFQVQTQQQITIADLNLTTNVPDDEAGGNIIDTAGWEKPNVTLTITDEIGNPVGNVSQAQYVSIWLTIYQMPVSVNSSICDVYERMGTYKASDPETKSLIMNGRGQCHGHFAALDGYAVEDKIGEHCWTPPACLEKAIDRRAAFMASLIARVATQELASGLPTDALVGNTSTWVSVYSENQANMLPFITLPQLKKLHANATTTQLGNVTTQ